MIPAATLLALGAQYIPTALQYLTGDSQEEQARKLKYVDETPDAEKEALALARQRAGDARLPGEGLLADRIAQQQAATSTAARASGGSAVSILAALNAGQRNSDNALADLAVKSAENQQRSQSALVSELGRTGSYQQASRDKYNAAKSALIQGGIQNKFEAAKGGAAAAAYTAIKLNQGNNPVLPGTSTTTSTYAGSPIVPYRSPEEEQYNRLFGRY